MAKSLKGKSAIVTGSTSGIGLGIAKILAEEGANILLNGFGDKAEIEKMRYDMEEKYKVKVSYSDADLTKSEKVKKMVVDAEAIFGSIDILVNNAGIQHVSPIEDFSDERWEAVIATNLSDVFYAVKAALPGMKKRNFGRIINIASAHGLVASANKSAYVAAKHGVVGLTKVIALEVAKSNITCNSICPGWVLTPLVQKQIDEKAKAGNISVEQASKSLLSEKQPNERFATPEEIGSLVVYLCSDAARNITGSSISIDGGWTAQ